MKIKVTSPVKGTRKTLERKAIFLSKYCPVDRKNPVQCPLCNLRKMNARDRRLWVHGLTLGDLRYLVLYHATCSIIRRKKLRRRKARLHAPSIQQA